MNKVDVLLISNRKIVMVVHDGTDRETYAFHVDQPVYINSKKVMVDSFTPVSFAGRDWMALKDSNGNIVRMLKMDDVKVIDWMDSRPNRESD